MSGNMRNRYLIVSDLHLTDVEDHDDGWKSYKGSNFAFDDEFDALIDLFMTKERQARPAVPPAQEGKADDGETTPLTLIFNGDTFDFDLVTAIPEPPPWKITNLEKTRGLSPTAPKSVYKLEKILEDHRQFITTLSSFLAAGNRTVFVMGNHDRELHFTEVQAKLVSIIGAEMERIGGKPAPGSITFEPWFYYIPGEIYAEHGNQYDYYSSFRYLLSPVVSTSQGDALSLPMGNLSNRYLMTRMGFFNPFASDYILNFFRYISHWFKRYAFSHRSLVINWAWGSLLVMGQLLNEKKKLIYTPPDYQEKLQAEAGRHGLSKKMLRKLQKLQPLPISHRFFRIVREFWMDRVLLILLMTIGTVTLALVPIPLWIKLMVPLSAFPLLFFVYEYLAKGETVYTFENAIPEDARNIAELLPVKFVIFGHTHNPCVIPLKNGASYINTGTWAPIIDHSRHDRPAPGLKNFALITIEKEGNVVMSLGSWT